MAEEGKARVNREPGISEKQCNPPFVNVGTSQDEQAAGLASAPRQELSKKVGQKHAQTRLDVLESEVFGRRAPVDLELRLLVGHEGEEVPD